MKVLLNVPSFYPAVCYGGPIFSTLNLSKALVSLGVDLKVITTDVNCTGKLELKKNKFIRVEGLWVKYYGLTLSYRYAFSFMQLFCVWKDVQKADLQYINSIFTFSVPIGLIYSKVFNKPTILAPRGVLGDWVMSNGSNLKKIWLRIFIKPFANSIFWHATSEQEKQEIQSHFPNARVMIIPNGIWVDEFNKSKMLSKSEYLIKYINKDIADVDKIIVSMGRLQMKKGFHILIDSFVELCKIYPRSYLLIAGPDEGEKHNLEYQILNLGLVSRVFLIGNVESQVKIDFLANSDLFVLPSYNENFGNVYLESLATGAPIVASLGTPWGEVEKYECGKWVENSTEETVKAMIDVLGKDREEMRENSMKLASKYDWSSVSMSFYNVFLQVIKERL